MSLCPILKTSLTSSLLTGLNPSCADEQSIRGILASADPMQTLIDGMQFGTKPGKMFGGHEASGATEIGGSGANLTNSGALQEQSSEVLGPGNFSYLDNSTDGIYSTDSALSVGLQSFAFIHVCSMRNPTATKYLLNDFETAPAFLGWRLYIQSSGTISVSFDSASGSVVSAVAGHSIDELLVIIGRRNMATLKGQLHTHRGDGFNATVHNETITPTINKFAIGRSTYNGSGLGEEWGLTGVWFGDAPVAALGGIHAVNLKNYLGG